MLKSLLNNRSVTIRHRHVELQRSRYRETLEPQNRHFLVSSDPDLRNRNVAVDQFSVKNESRTTSEIRELAKESFLESQEGRCVRRRSA
jgi:hypothetical protein